MNALVSDPDPAAEWERLRPMIDEVIHDLDERDREAVLLRYFENRPFAEIGATLRLSEDAARMRVAREIEELRGALARRGVKSTSAALAAVFANQVGATAPVGLAGAIATAALAGAGGVAAAGVGFFMSMKTTAIISAVALAAIGSTLFQWNYAQRAEAELAALTLDRDSLRSELRDEQQRTSRTAQDIAVLRGEIDSLKAKQSAPPAAPPIVSSAAPAPVLTAEELRVVELSKTLQAATDAYRAANNGNPPPKPEALIPYFTTPQAGADFIEFLEAMKTTEAAKKAAPP